LDRARYHHLTAETFEFFAKTITPRGNFLHKYTPAGDFGSTWHSCAYDPDRRDRASSLCSL
ncbi:MAG: hypothetical protein WAQ02_00965, partial [Methanosarcina flavescens]